MTDQTHDHDLHSEPRALRSAIGSRALTAAVLFAQAGHDRRKGRQAAKRLIPIDTD